MKQSTEACLENVVRTTKPNVGYWTNGLEIQPTACEYSDLSLFEQLDHFQLA